uniref:Uncharacterized protein n=1 Tax=Morchella brunnea TaxID=1174671 RepID=A0A8K1I853_9PEZI|nr:hypothetical protein LK370_mgp062 [Morchella brunnea]UBU98454.1 hypothetical protein [Morchella brunnea]
MKKNKNEKGGPLFSVYFREGPSTPPPTCPHQTTTRSWMGVGKGWGVEINEKVAGSLPTDPYVRAVGRQPTQGVLLQHPPYLPPLSLPYSSYLISFYLSSQGVGVGRSNWLVLTMSLSHSPAPCPWQFYPP